MFLTRKNVEKDAIVAIDRAILKLRKRLLIKNEILCLTFKKSLIIFIMPQTRSELSCEGTCIDNKFQHKNSFCSLLYGFGHIGVFLY